MALPCLVKFVGMSNFAINSFIVLATVSFQIFVVLPEIYQQKSVVYYLCCIFEIFIHSNIIGNLFAACYVDTSIDCIKERPPKDSTQHPSWHFCRICDALVPPRSWHCNICDICILKRDHHCSFTGRCVGHRNYRYFYMFVCYVAMATTSFTINTSIYCWWLKYETFCNWSTALKLVFPYIFIWFLKWENAFLFLYELNFTFALISCGLMVVYTKCLLSGVTIYEFRSKNFSYDLGSKKRNLESVLGKRMHLIWLAPFIKSDQLHDGINWETRNEDQI